MIPSPTAALNAMYHARRLVDRLVAEQGDDTRRAVKLYKRRTASRKGTEWCAVTPAYPVSGATSPAV